jgi:hypothetical protein
MPPTTKPADNIQKAVKLRMKGSATATIDEEVGPVPGPEWVNRTPRPADATDPLSQQAEWMRRMKVWALRVRRDILVLEETVKATSPGITFYGDPGDPPPPPPPDW